MRKRQSGETAANDATDPRSVTALDRGLALLRAFHPNDPPLGNQELAARTGLPRPTVSRLTYTLMRQGFLDYVETSGKYRLGLPLLALGHNALSGLSMRQAARPLMQPLADQLGLTVALTSRDRLAMVYVEFCRGGGADPFWLDVGFQIGIAESASGRAYLAALPPADRTALLGQLAGRHGAAWPALQAEILQAVENYRRQGFCRSAGAWRSQASFLAVPLQTGGGDFSGFVVNCGGPTYLLERHRLDEDLGPRLGALAESLSAALFGH